MKTRSTAFLIVVSFLFGAALVSFFASPASTFSLENVIRLLIMLCTLSAMLLHVSRI